MSKKVKIKKIYTLTLMQQGILFHTLMNPESPAYFEQMTYDIKGKFSVECYEKSFNLLVKKYDVLRTIFKFTGTEEPIQIVLMDREFKVQYEDISDLDELAQQVFIADYQQRDINKGFNLQKDILMRVSVLKLNENCHKIIWSHHHIIMDGWCTGIIMRDVFENYSRIMQGLSVNTEDLYPFGNYVNWLKKQDKDEALVYWKENFKDYAQSAVVPQKTVCEEGYSNTRFSFNIPAHLVQHLKQLALSVAVPVNIVYEVIWGLILQRYNNTDEAVYGLVISGRPPQVEGVEQMIGLFINTIPISIKTEDNMTFVELLKKTYSNSIDSKSYEYCSLADIQAQTSLRNNLINHVLVIEDYPLEQFLDDLTVCKEMGWSIENVENFEQTNYDFNIDILPGDETTVEINYNSNLYDQYVIENIQEHFMQVINQIVQENDIKVNSIDLVVQQEREKLLYAFNHLETEKELSISYDLTKTLPQLFEEHAAKNPDKTAIIFGDDHITYAALNKKANQIGHYLRQEGVQAESFVAVMLERSPLFVESVMGVWKAGGTYIPIDTGYPIQRKLGILEDAKANYVITLSKYIDATYRESYKGKIICLDEISKALIHEENLGINILSNQLAYILFTSGSTGKPKGVMIEHQGMLNHILAEQEQLQLDETMVFAQNANQCFDISVWQFFGALALGGTTAIYSNEVVLAPEIFVKRIIQDGVTLLEVVPSYLMVVMDYIEANHITLDALKYLLITGEAAKLPVVQRWFELCKEIPMVNAYGPAEASDDVTQGIMHEVPAKVANISIGKPVANMRMYIVDDHMRLCPLGIPGELCVAGIGVGRGYVNDPERTANAFMIDPYMGTQCQRLYKTGDIGKWLPDGNIEFIGRKDFQVKIRGFRIELGEIENKLLDHPSIKNVIVIDMEEDNGNKYLCAYFSAHQVLEANDLKQYLMQYLPDYMIPTYFIQLEELPLLISGKVDRKALPKPEQVLKTEYRKPENEVEERLVEIWKNLLDRSKVSTTDNFFELGGHSLLAIRLVSKVNSEFKSNVTLSQVFDAPTIKAFAQVVEGKEKGIKYEALSL